MASPKIIFEDQAILCLDKPPGLVVTPSETSHEKTLSDILINEHGIKLERGGVVHRLDKDTSGVILVAKTIEAFEELQRQFKERIVKKEYLALVHGQILESGRVEGSIGRNPLNREKFMVIDSRLRGNDMEAEGKEAVTEYEPMERLQVTGDRLQEIFSDFNKIQMRKLSTVHYNLFTFIRCKPLTGRTHQIRVHLKYIGHPVVSDEKYVGRKMYRLDHRWCPRQFLHAAKIGFNHPISGEWIELKSDLPEDLKVVLDSLRSLEQYSSTEPKASGEVH